MSNKQLDFLAIGDITTDAFIRLKDAHVHCNLKSEARELCVRFGDKIPYEFVEVVPAVGNSANASVSASRLGLSSGLIADIGDDENGRECLATLEKEKVSTEYIKIHDGMKTNYHYVLWYGDDRTILVKHQEYAREFPDAGSPKWIYLSSLGPNSENYHTEITEYLKKEKDAKLVFQPGTFQINLGKEKMEIFYRLAEVFVANMEEAEKILGIKEKDAKKILEKMREMGPKIVVITDGPRGAYLHFDGKFFFMPPYPDPKPPYNRTGAGDAYASTFASGLALGKSPEEAILWSPINSMSVVQKIGAQRGLLTKAEIESFLKKAPEDYKLKKIS